MKMMFLHPGNHAPSARFRVFPFVKEFRAAGHHVTLAGSFPEMYDYYRWLGFRPSQWLKRITRSLHLMTCYWTRFDIIILSRELFDAPDFEWELRFRKVAQHLVLDIDDAIFLRYPQKFEELVKVSDLVIAGNQFLEEKITSLDGRCIVIPTCVETRDLPTNPRKTNSAPVIGWIGTSSNLSNFHLCAEALKQVARSYNFELRIISDTDLPLQELDLADINYRFMKWDPRTAEQEIADFDIGLMPLEDNEWNRYKCGFKLLQYMSHGVPGIASPIGVNAEIIDHGVNGFLASNENEWRTALLTLLSDESMRIHWGESARQKVAEKYSIETNFPKYQQALLELAHENLP